MSPRPLIRLFTVLSLLGLLLGAQPVHPVLAAPFADSECVYRVKGDAAGSTHDGSTWTNAFTDLQSALAAASDGCEIWVAAGTYTPTNTTDRTISFRLLSGVAVYGGFTGVEEHLAQRNSDPATNNTILSGDIEHNDASIGIVGNSYHVVIGADRATLDGFTVSGGNANVECQEDSIYSCFGGGMFNKQSSPTVNNVIFSGNRAIEGGGMHNYLGGRPALTNVTFTGNSAKYGGGLENYEGAATDLTQVTFASNSATENGGGMHEAHLGSSLLRHVTFSSNAANNGGGLDVDSSSDMRLEDTLFNANAATILGGGVHLSGSSLTLMNTTFHNNFAQKGAGVAIVLGAPILSNITFSGNSASALGGGIYDEGSGPTLTNVTFSGNSANDSGGGMYNGAFQMMLGEELFSAPSNPVLKNVTITGNSANVSGGGMYNGAYVDSSDPQNPVIAAPSIPQVTNSIVWGNSTAGTDAQVHNDHTDGPVYNHTLVEGGGDLTGDPLFGSLADYGGGQQTVALLPGSAAIDAGLDSACAGTDQRGLDRVGVCDLGAFESQGFSLGQAEGSNQTTAAGTAFTNPLTLTVTAKNSAEPVNGGQVTFTGPVSGAGIISARITATVTGGKVSQTMLANRFVGGPYPVTAGANGAASITFSLRNTGRVFLPVAIK